MFEVGEEVTEPDQTDQNALIFLAHISTETDKSIVNIKKVPISMLSQN